MNTQYYEKNEPDKMILRDHLAFDRTILATERTILAHIRTSLVSMGGGITFLKLFPNELSMAILGWIFLILALTLLIFGGRRFIKSKQSLNNVYKK